MWILSSREKVLDIWCEVFMESFRAYLKQTKIFFIACVFMAAVSTAVICLYQLPLEAAVYLAVLWLGAGAAVFLYGYACYRQKVQNLILVEKAPEINLDRLGETTDEVELLYRDIIRKLDGMRMGAETERQRSLEEMTDYYTMWAHQIKTPITGLKLLLDQEEKRVEHEEDVKKLRQMKEELFSIEDYVGMNLEYIRLDSLNADLSVEECHLETLVKKEVMHFSQMFIARQLSIQMENLDHIVISDSKWLAFVLDQILSNALKYTKKGGICISAKEQDKKVYLMIQDTGIGIAKEDLPRILEKAFTGFNGHVDHKATGIGLYLSKQILDRLGHRIKITSQVGKGTCVTLCFLTKM